MENIVVRGTTIICKDNPEWGTWGIMEDCGDWFEIRNSRGTRVLFKSEFLEHWEVVK